jgi:5-methylcytosine-specific restriction endonuclease McrA
MEVAGNGSHSVDLPSVDLPSVSLSAAHLSGANTRSVPLPGATVPPHLPNTPPSKSTGGRHGRPGDRSGADKDTKQVVAVLRVLLLNASHEPLAVVTGRRALVLVVAGKAECLLERPAGSVVRSPSMTIAVPAVVRLRRYVRVPYQPPPAVTRAGILRRDSRRCAYCRGRGDTVDHVIPKSRGGSHSWENCVACCVRCNTRKADRLLDELGWPLPFNPGPPRRGAGRLWSTEDADPVWQPWLPIAA